MPTQTVFTMEGAAPAGTSVAGSTGQPGPALINANQVTVNSGTAFSSAVCVMRGTVGITLTTGSAALSVARFLHTVTNSNNLAVAFAVVVGATPASKPTIIATVRYNGGAAARLQWTTANVLQLTSGTGLTPVNVVSNLAPGTLYWITVRATSATSTTGAWTTNVYDRNLTLVGGNSAAGYNLGSNPLIGGDFGIVNVDATTGTQVSIDHVMFEDSTNELFPAATAFNGALGLSGSGSFTTSGSPAFNGSMGLTGAGALGFTGKPAVAGVLDFTGAGSLSYAAVVSFVQSLAFNGSGALAFAGTPTVTAQLALAGGGALQLTGNPGATGALEFSGDGSVSFSGASQKTGVLLLGGEGTFGLAGVSGTGGLLQLSGSATLGLAGSPLIANTLLLGGDGQLSFDATLALFGTLDMAGAGTLTITQTVPKHHYKYGSTGLTTRWSGSISGSRWAGDFTTRWNGNLNG